ncbi:gliding motility-associated C-terminal domain-containing protein [Nonlabens ulvanivorans]|uniref:gliding motility-associated C-terminal domain-containing protein n=5 Tax=Nonlabens ulvanivorans TaxID=906888 RepID=UPI003265B671
MKKNLLTSWTKRKLLFIALLGLPFLSIQAQCPTVPISPQVICDASQLTFNDLDAFVTSGPNAVRWFLNPTGGSAIPQTQLVRQGTYYAGDTTGACGTRSPLVIDFTVDPSGQSLDAIFCSNEMPTVQSYIDTALAVNIPAGGSVEVYSDFALTMMVSPSSALSGNANYFIVFVDATGCKGQIESGSTAVFPSPNAPTPPLTQEFCSDTNPTVADLNPGTTDNFNWYSDVDIANNPIPPALQLTTPLIDGETYYIQADNFFCESDVVAVTVQIDDPANPGIGDTIEYCVDSLPASDFDLFPLLTGMPDTSGTWSGPTTITNGNQGTTNISTLIAGTYNYVYTVPGPGACPDENTTIVIVINDVLSSGMASAIVPLNFCESQAPTAYDLFLLLDNEDAGGTWTQGSTSASPVINSPFDFTGLMPGTYDFTYSQNLSPNPCPEESTTVQVTVLQDPNAGTAIATEFCENDLVTNSPYDLFSSLDGTQDNNLGTWTDASNSVVTNPIDITGLTVAGSPYNYTYTIDNGSCTDTESIVITILPAPESGNYIGTPFEICEDQVAANSPYDLFNLLDGTQDTNGTWYAGNSSTGTAVTNPIDLTTLGNGTFNFTYNVPAIGTCTDVDVTVTVIINPLPDTGVPTPLSVCINDLAANSPVDLFNQLTGQDAGGTWSDDDATGALTGSTVDITGFAVGTYNFSYSITDVNGCMNSSTVAITIEPAPESGNYVGTPFEICEDQVAANSPYDLFNLLDGTQDTNGTWYTGNTSTGTAVTNPIDLTTLGNGTFNFTYNVPAIGTCTDVDVTVTVVIYELANSGTVTPFLVCETDLAANSPLDLFGQLTGEDIGGTWNDDNATGALTAANVDLTLLAIGTYNFSYTVVNGNCTSTSIVPVTVEIAPEAGTATNFDICISDLITGQTLDLFNQLTGNDAGGAWNDDDTTGVLSGSNVDLTLLSTGSYNFTYTVPALGTCASDSVTVTITLNDIAAPSASMNQDFCDNATVADLVATGNNVQWYEDAALTMLSNSTDALIDGEDYYATQIDGLTNCESSVAVAVVVTIFNTPNTGIDVPLTVCSDVTAVDLFSALDGSQDNGGIWLDTDGTGALTGNLFNASMVVDGSYDFEYAITGNAPCADSSTVVTIVVQSPVTAGSSTSIDLCNDNGMIDLFTLLGSADIGGTWTPMLNSTTGVFDPLVDSAGSYQYTVMNDCNTDTATITVNLTTAPNAGLDSTLDICVIDAPIDLLTQLGGTPDSTGTWLPMLNGGGNIFDPSVDTAGVYVYTVAATTPCSTDATSQIVIQVDDSAAPMVVNATLEFCATDDAMVMDLDAAVNGTMITWYNSIDSTTPLADADLLIDGTTYYATQTNATGCESSVRAQVSVVVGDAPTPTLSIDGNLFCINDSPTLENLIVNINEYDMISSNVVWYDAVDSSTALSLSTILVNGTTYYAALIDSVTGCESNVRLAVTTDLTACGKVIVPDGFSPNNDGVNDTFDVENLGFLYPNFKMEIYNRYGNLVYEGTNSTPRFNGFANQKALLSDGELPVGVYFYILNFNDGSTKPEQGRLYLSR